MRIVLDITGDEVECSVHRTGPSSSIVTVLARNLKRPESEPEVLAYFVGGYDQLRTIAEALLKGIGWTPARLRQIRGLAPTDAEEPTPTDP